MIPMSNSNNPFHIIEPFYSSQSATSCYQECNRRYFYQYRMYGTGIVPNFTSVPLATGTSVHIGCGAIAIQHFNGAKDIDLDKSIQIAKQHYTDEVNRYPLVNIKDEYQESVYHEQLALIEALIRIWYLIEWPKILEFYNIIAIEQEIMVPISNVWYQIKPDLILQDKRNGDIVNYSLKTTKQYDDRTEEALTSQMQVSTEPYGTSAWLYQIKEATKLVLDSIHSLPNTVANQRIIKHLEKTLNLPDKSSATRFCYLIKGAWKEEDKGKGNWYTDSSLLYGWRKFTPGGIEYAPSFWTHNPENKSGFGRLGKGWEKFKVWENSDIREDIQIDGLKGWIQYLFDNHKETLIKYIVSSPEIYVNPKLQESRIRQIGMLEKLATTGLIELQIDTPEGTVDKTILLDEVFPMNTGSCVFPSKCDYLTICPTGNRHFKQHIADDPLNEEYGMYRRRISHHQPEKERFEAEGTN